MTSTQNPTGFGDSFTRGVQGQTGAQPAGWSWAPSALGQQFQTQGQSSQAHGGSSNPAQQFQAQTQPTPQNQGGFDANNPSSWWPYMAPPNFQGVPPGTLHPSQIPSLASTPGGTPTTQPFLSPGMIAPWYSYADTAGAIGTMGAQAAPGAAAWATEQFNPGFNAHEQQFMQGMSELGSDQFTKTMAAVGQKFGQTPFHSAYLQAGHDLARNANKDLLQAGMGLQQQRQQQAGQQATRVLGSPMDAAGVGPQVAASVSQLLQQIGQQQYQFPLQLYTQIPFSAPTVIQSPAVWGNR